MFCKSDFALWRISRGVNLRQTLILIHLLLGKNRLMFFPCYISCLSLQDSVLRNCRPSMRPFKASKMRLLFLFLLGLMLFMAVMVIGYIIMNDDR